MYLKIIDNRIRLCQNEVILRSYNWLDSEQSYDDQLIWYFKNTPYKFNIKNKEEIILYKQLLEMEV